MKKITLTLVMALCVFAFASAQEESDALVSKKGINILPEAGDYVIGFNAVPVLNFALNAVNIFGSVGNTAMHPGYTAGNTNVLVGKYFVDDATAYRGRVAITKASVSNTTYFDDPKDKSADPAEIMDKSVVGTSGILLGAGIEKRRGYGRLQGFYGGEALIGFAGGSTKNTFGVALDKEAVDSSYANADGSLVSAGRVLSIKNGTALTLGVRGFAGVEYFVAPKISIGAEFGWGLGVSTTPRGSAETETWDATAASVKNTVTTGSTKASTTAIGVDNGLNTAVLGAGSAALNIFFHF